MTNQNNVNNAASGEADNATTTPTMDVSVSLPEAAAENLSSLQVEKAEEEKSEEDDADAYGDNNAVSSSPEAGVCYDTNFVQNTTATVDGSRERALPLTDEDDDDDEEEKKRLLADGYRLPLNPIWTKLTGIFRNTITKGVTTCALHAVKYPKQYIACVTALSLLLIISGFFTNFRLILNIDEVFTPYNSRPLHNSQWIKGERGFPQQMRTIQLIFHNDGENVLHVEQLRRVFEAVNVIRTTPGYKELCAKGTYLDFETDEPTCRIFSVTGFFKNHNITKYTEQVKTDEDLRRIISANELANGSPIFHDLIIGKYKKDPKDGIINFAASYLITLDIPGNQEETETVEAGILHRLDTIRRSWMESDLPLKDYDDHDDDHYTKSTMLKLDMMSIYAFQLEILRTIIGDIYILPICCMIMIGFTCLFFYLATTSNSNSCNKSVQSRSMLGIASVITISMSMMTANGLMFILGVPYCIMHQVLPFVILGVGLDDTFIITNAYFRTNNQDSIEHRIRETMEEVGSSIALTTITTVFAFLLGYLSSSLPGVHWLCLSAMSTIAIDFYYQITYFVAFLVLDEQRIQVNRKDCCFWIIVNNESEHEKGNERERENITIRDNNKNENNNNYNSNNPHLPERIMKWYSNFLLRPITKLCILILFGIFFGVCCYSVSKMEQQFDVSAFVTEDSYLKNTFTSLDEYSNVVRPLGVYFRGDNMNQSDIDVQQQMISYIEELELLPQIAGGDDGDDDLPISNVNMANIENLQGPEEIRPFCWVRDLQRIEQQMAETDPFIAAALAGMTSNQKLDFALQNKIFREVYGQDIIRDADTGQIISSRCFVFLSDLDLKSVEEQMAMLADQRELTQYQPLNTLNDYNKENWPMFTFDDMYFYWEAYAVAVQELIFTMIAGAVAVTFITFVFIPHWTAALFVFPMIVILYIELLGLFNIFGLSINGFTYICVVVAIGLLIDFLIHILLRYYETKPNMKRNERVQETLETMGVSILVGGLTTFLGVMPIAISSLRIFMNIFYAFLSMVILGISHGLIILPVMLSFFGPTMSVIDHSYEHNMHNINKGNKDVRELDSHSERGTTDQIKL